MKRVHIITICSLLLFLASCNSNNKKNEDINKEVINNVISPTTEPDNISPTIIPYNKSTATIPNIAKTADTSVRTIFCLDKGFEEAATTEEGKFPDIIQINFDSEQQEVDFIKSYLLERGISKEVPDGMSCCGEKKVVEYYVDNENRNISFILRIKDAILFDVCFFVTLNLDDMAKVGYLTYRFDEKIDKVYECIYDMTGEQMAQIAYQYNPSIPFPLITEYEDISSYKDSIGDVLFRSQKFWIYEKMAKFDVSGKLITYENDIFEPDDIHSQSVFSYDKKCRLDKIEGTLSQSDLKNYFSEEEIAEINCADISEIDLNYQENGMLEKVIYQHAPKVYGTTGHAGRVYYDEQGRMVYESSYITHGATEYFYIYHEEEKTPWACICIDSMSYGGSEKDGYEYSYGNRYSIYLFQST